MTNANPLIDKKEQLELELSIAKLENAILTEKVKKRELEKQINSNAKA